MLEIQQKYVCTPQYLSHSVRAKPFTNGLSFGHSHTGYKIYNKTLLTTSISSSYVSSH